jgi:two-component system, chemotaxis family, sensor kinase CheA
MAFSLGEYQDIFLEEADDQLQELNASLLSLEQNPDDDDTINNIFRAAHSLKSSAAFVGLNDLSDLAHKMENLLQGIRDKTMNITPEIIEVLFRCFDVINSVIDTVSQGNKPTDDLTGIIQQVVEIGSRSKSDTAAAAPEAKAPAQKIQKAGDAPKLSFTPQEKKSLKRGIDNGMSCFDILISIEPEAPMKWVKAQLIINNLKHSGQVLRAEPPEEDYTDEKIGKQFRIILLSDETKDEIRRTCDIDLVTKIEITPVLLVQKDDKYVIRFGETSVFEDSTEESPKPPLKTAAVKVLADHDDDAESKEDEQKKSIQADKKGGTTAPTLRTVKVSVDKLDELLNTVGELVISNSGFYRLYEDLKNLNADKSLTGEFKSRMEQMSRIAKDLQSGIMKTRMVPIGQVFSRFNRLVRDLAKDCNKQVQLVLKGEDTELDKKVIDVIGEPLMHLVRNAIDHGIENPDERVRMKKPELGTVTLDAYQAGNQILVEVSDDGKGLNVPAIRKKALENGLASTEQLANMDEHDIFDFIFHPGFSTAVKVTEVSGRGVGMNVVKEVVNEMNGSIAIESEPGMGTRFVMAFPLTLAIIPAIMVKVQKEIYAVPLNDVIETIKIASTDITTIEGHEVINLRGEILSLLRLNFFVNINSSLEDQTKIPVVVVGYGNRKIGLIVDELEGKQEIVIKSLEQNYATVQGLAGASILGDGSICLILDISSMISRVIQDQDKLSREQRQRILERDNTVFEEAVSPAPVLKAPESKPAFSAPASAPRSEKSAAPLVTPPEPKKETAPLIAETQTVTVKSDVLFEKKTPDQIIKPSADASVETRVKDALSTFKAELEDNIDSTFSTRHDDHIQKQLSIKDSDLRKIQVLANVGITHGAESLSKIIGKQVDLAIPEVRLLPIEKVPEMIGGPGDVYIGVFMPLTGDIKGTVLLSLPEQSGFELIDSLFGLATGETKELSEDGESALMEITNIVGTSVVNAISERTKLVIMPDVPNIRRDYMQSILDSILALYNIQNDYVLTMDTEFYHEDDRVMGNLLILPETESLQKLVEHLQDG